MSDKSRLVIGAAVTANERPAVQLAADLLAKVLGEAAGTPWACDVKFADDPSTLIGEGAEVLVTSLLPELVHLSDPWEETEKRLRAEFAKLTERGTPVFVSTILRNADDVATIIRLRRLNLLAADISRESGAYVIDIDRVLANIGARWLKTDYRLGGEKAASVTGHLIAQTLLNNAIDAHVTFEVQEAAQTALEKLRPAIAQGDGHELRMEQRFQAIKQGRRTQTVIPVVYADRDVAAGLLFERAMRGKLGFGEIYTHLTQAVQHHGVKGTVVLVSSMISRKLRRK